VVVLRVKAVEVPPLATALPYAAKGDFAKATQFLNDRGNGAAFGEVHRQIPVAGEQGLGR
jgi:hypothetical protein